MMRYFSTFSGIGGFELGIKQVYETKNSRVVDKTRQVDSISRRQEAVNSSRVSNTLTEQQSNGIDENGKQVEISDTQRYKVLGNAISVPVVQHIMEKLLL